MKKLVLLIFCAGVVSTCPAQKVTYSPEIGLNINTINWKNANEKIETKTKLGWTIGGLVNIPIYKNFYLQPGVFYSTKGFKNYKELSIGYVNTKGEFNYIEVPLNAMYKYSFTKGNALFATVGPYIGIATNGKVTEYVANTGSSTTSGTFENEITFGSESGELDRLDYGLNAGVGYETRMGLYFRCQYGLGLANISNEASTDIKNSTIKLSVGFTFGK